MIGLVLHYILGMKHVSRKRALLVDGVMIGLVLHYILGMKYVIRKIALLVDGGDDWFSFALHTGYEVCDQKNSLICGWG